MGNSALRCIGADQIKDSSSKPRAKASGTKNSSKQQQHHHGSLLRALSSSSSSSTDSCDSAASSCSNRRSSSHHRRSLTREASLEILPESQDGVTRLKLVISKQQVDDILAGDYASSKLDFFDNLVTSMLKQELAQAAS